MESTEHLLSIAALVIVANCSNLTSQDIPCRSTPLGGHPSRLKNLRPHFGIRSRREKCRQFRQFRAAHWFGHRPISFGKIRLLYLAPYISETDRESINLQPLSAQDKAQADKSTPPVNGKLNLHQNMWARLSMDYRNLIETLAVEIDGERRLFDIVPAPKEDNIVSGNKL
jgi:hypothetical protein